MPLPRPLLKALVTVAFVAALLAPFVVVLAAGWIEIHFTAWGEQPGPDPTPVEAWVALAVGYVVWAPLVTAGLIFALDRSGYRYTPPESRRRESRAQRRRRAAGIKYLQSLEMSPPARRRRGTSAPSDSPRSPRDD